MKKTIKITFITSNILFALAIIISLITLISIDDVYQLDFHPQSIDIIILVLPHWNGILV